MAEDIKVRVQALKRGEFHGYEYMIADHVAEVDEKLTREQILEPTFWAGVSSLLKERDKVTIFPHDNSYEASLRVVYKTGTLVYFKVIDWVVYDANLPKDDNGDIEYPEPSTMGFEVKFKGPNKKFCIVDKDGVILEGKEGYDKATAQKQLDDHLRALAA